MTRVIGDYTAAATIDGSTNYLLIQPGNSSTAYKKINRNVFLGVTGQPVDISSSQNLTNKTLDNTNTVTVKDTLFTLQDNGDVTKQARFELSGLTTATTRTYTLPDATTTIVGTGTTQTLTGKTLTAPVINNGSITGTTITTDAIVGQSASTSGTIYGMSISSAKVGSNGVVTASITDGAVTPAKLQSGTGSTWAWQTWTPTLTNLTIGNGALGSNRYIQIGKTVHFSLNILFGTTTSMSTAPKFTLPVTARSVSNFPWGIANYLDNSAGNLTYIGQVTFDSTTVARLAVTNASATYATIESVTATVPFTWAVSDSINIFGSYEAA